MEMSTGNKVHPCLTPMSTRKRSVTWLLCMTQHSTFSYKAWMIFTNFCGIPWCRRIFQSDGWCRLSRAYSKYTNTTDKELFHPRDCSRIWRRTKMWSMHDRPYQKPACLWRSSLSTAVVMRWRMMRQKTLLMMDSSVLPLQLLHSDRFPFFSLISIPLFQALGITSLSQTSWRMCLRSCGVSCPLPSASQHTHCRPLQLLDCVFDLQDGDGPKFDVQVTNVSKCRRFTSVEELLKVFSLLWPFLQWCQIRLSIDYFTVVVLSSVSM